MMKSGFEYIMNTRYKTTVISKRSANLTQFLLKMEALLIVISSVMLALKIIRIYAAARLMGKLMSAENTPRAMHRYQTMS